MGDELKLPEKLRLYYDDLGAGMWYSSPNNDSFSFECGREYVRADLLAAAEKRIAELEEALESSRALDEAATALRRSLTPEHETEFQKTPDPKCYHCGGTGDYYLFVDSNEKSRCECTLYTPAEVAEEVRLAYNAGYEEGSYTGTGCGTGEDVEQYIAQRAAERGKETK